MPLSLLFPPRCLACRDFLRGAASAFCRPCSETVVELAPPFCARCGAPDISGTCAPCLEAPPSFELARAAFLYGGALGEAIETFKYGDAPHFGLPLASMARTAARDLLDWADLIVPMPLHRRRLGRRGYNQAAELARPLARWRERPMAQAALERLRATRPQVGLDRTTRWNNVSSAFRGDARQVSGARVLLIDDVMTTGATARSASEALRAAGAQAVRVFCLARAPGAP